MSVPAADIRCTTCDFHASDAVGWGRFVYELSDRTQIPLERSLGWCYSCNTLVPVEELSKEANKVEIRAKIFDLQCKLDNAVGGLGSLLGFNKDKIKRLERDLAYYQKTVFETTLYSNMLQSRIGSARCLKCSSRDILYCDLPETEEGKPPVPTGFLHPECGGQFTIQNTGFRIALRFDHIHVYDPEGVYLRDDYSPNEY